VVFLQNMPNVTANSHREIEKFTGISRALQALISRIIYIVVYALYRLSNHFSEMQRLVSVSILSVLDGLPTELIFTIFHEIFCMEIKCGRLDAYCFSGKPEVYQILEMCKFRFWQL